MPDKKTLIYQCAKEVFSKKGFKDASIAEITAQAGLAVGTFYRYYPSKEKLFMEMFLDENAALKRRCLESLDPSGSPKQVVTAMLALNAEGTMANPILRQWYDKQVFTRIERLFREEMGLDTVDFLYDAFHELVKGWQQTKKMRQDIDSRMIMMMFAAIINLDVHKEELGLEWFPRLQLLMTDLLLDSLTEGP